MTKQRQNGKKTNGGQQGGKGETKDRVARACAEATGRGRKIADRKGHAMAREQQFGQLCAQASTDERMLIEALDGKHQGGLVAVRVHKTVQRPVHQSVLGTVVLEITLIGEQPAVMVVGSDFGPIKRHGWWRLPLYALMVKDFESRLPDPHLRDWQNELVAGLTAVCTSAIADRRRRLWQEQHAPLKVADKNGEQTAIQVVNSQSKIDDQKVEPKVPKERARPLTFRRIEGQVGYFAHNDLFYDGLASGSAFIRQMIVAGAQKFGLVGVSADHPLRTLWDKVGAAEVQVDIADVFPKGPVTATNVDDTPMRAARREFARYLALRHTELKATDPAGATASYDPLEARGIYEQQAINV